MKKRLLALLLCLSMLLSFTVSTYAEGNGDLSSHGYYDDFEDVAGSGGNTNTEGGTTEIPVVPAPVDPAPGTPVQPGFEEDALPGVTVCEECGAANGHTETCSQYAAPKDDSEAKHEYYKLDQVAGAFDPDEAYAYLMACTTTEEMNAYADEYFTDEIVALFSEEQWSEITEHFGELHQAELEAKRQEIQEPAVNYDNVAQFQPAVIPKAPVRRMLMARATTNAVSYAAAANDVAEAAEGDDSGAADNGLELSKTVTGNATDGYTLTLEAYTTGTVKAGEATPSDIIMVLDMSTSMKEPFSYEKKYSDFNTDETYYVGDGDNKVEVTYCRDCRTWTNGCSDFWGHNPGEKYYPKTSASDTDTNHDQFYAASSSRLEALIEAATLFVDSVADEATDDRIAVVGFKDEASYLSGTTAANSLQDATEKEADLKEDVTITEDQLDYATEHGNGLSYAVNIFAAEVAAGTDYTNRNKVVVMLTDGEPEPMKSGDWSAEIVKEAVESSHTLKNTYSASVYCISVMPGTNAETITSNMDKYMDYVSSNYPDARYTGATTTSGWFGPSVITDQDTIIKQITPGSKIDTTKGGYYLTASNIATLNSIFGQIAAQTGGASIQLDEETIIRDVVTDAFVLPDGADAEAKGITVSTEDATYTGGTLGWTTSTIQDFNPTVTLDGKTINVSGFDFTRNFVAETGRVEGNVAQSGDFHGRKLIIEIPIEVRDGFLGGNGVLTNASGSGVYENSTAEKPLEEFVSPDVDVPIKDITVAPQDKNVYLSGSLTVDQLEDGLAVSVGDVALDMDANNYGLASWQNAYVTINDSDLKAVGNLMYDTAYAVTVKVEPTKTGTVGQKTGSGTGKINVFKPYFAVTATDIWADYGASVDLTKWGLAPTGNTETAPAMTTVWKHGETEADKVTMVGDTETKKAEPPAITPTAFTFERVGTNDGTLNTETWTYTTVEQDTNFNVTGMTCTVGSVAYTVPAEALTVTPAVPGDTNHDFTIHINKFALTITKTIDDYNGVYAQDFIFKITKGGTDESYQVVISGPGSKTISGLICGRTYTVTEDGKWSWRYEADGRKTVTKTTGPNGALGISNTDPGQSTPLTGTAGIKNTLTNDKWLSDSSKKDNCATKARRKAARKEG